MFSRIDLGKRPLYAKYYGTRTKLLVKVNCDFCLKVCSVNVPRSEVKFLGKISLRCPHYSRLNNRLHVLLCFLQRSRNLSIIRKCSYQEGV